MGELIVVSGPPGAGKSTVAKLLSAQFEASALMPADQFFGFIDPGGLHPKSEIPDQASSAPRRLIIEQTAQL